MQVWQRVADIISSPGFAGLHTEASFSRMSFPVSRIQYCFFPEPLRDSNLSGHGYVYHLQRLMQADQ
jgi:hypothetical protein